MNPGLPGLGIGGLFYLISAALMPLVALIRRFQGKPTRWRLAARQSAMAGAVFAATALTFWMLELTLASSATAAGVQHKALIAVGGSPVSMMMLSLAVLVAVLSLMQLMRLVLRHPPGRAARAELRVKPRTYSAPPTLRTS